VRFGVRPRSALRVRVESEREKEGKTIMSEAQKPAEQSPQEILFAIAGGYLVSRSLHVAADLGIADLLSAGPKSIEELARATGAHPQSLYRLLRALAGHGVFAEDPPGRFHLTPPAALLQTEVPGSLRDIVRMAGDMAGDGKWWNLVGQLRRTVLTGEPEFERVYGMGFYEYLAKDPAANDWWARALLSLGTTENAAIVGCYNFGQFRRIVDVAGGRGGFLAEVLKAYPTVRGVLYDHPEVVKEPTPLVAAGLMARCEVRSLSRGTLSS
jgi:O-methyltransferase domain/Dimerisation domain